MTTLRAGGIKQREFASGVSLIELAVVISIIALIISVMAGAIKIQRASFIQGTLSDIGGHQTSFENFEQQYASVPGDMDDAKEYWGAETDNGDGDGDIAYAASGNCESLRAWQHLSLAGYVQGGYTGTSSGSGNQADIGVNVPESSRNKIGYYTEYASIGGITARNNIVIGAFSAGGKNGNASLVPKDAKAIDLKADDGLPNAGKVRADKGADIADAAQCASASAYNLATDDPACVVAFPILP